MAMTDWSNEPIDLATRRIDELEKRIKMLSARVYDLECNREKSEEELEEELEEERERARVRLDKERQKAQTELVIASNRLLQAAQDKEDLEWSAAEYRVALKRCNDLGIGLSE